MYNKHLTKYFFDRHILNKNYLTLDMMKDYINRGLDIHYNNDAIIYSIVSVHHNIEILQYLLEKYNYNQDVKDYLLKISFLRYYDISKYLFSIGSTIHKYIEEYDKQLYFEYMRKNKINKLIN